MIELSIAIVASVYIVMKFKERIAKEYFVRKTIEKEEYEKVVEEHKQVVAVAQKNFENIQESLEDIRSEMQEVKDFQLVSPAKSGGFR